MTHDQVRELLSAGEADEQATKHLARCTQCRRWSKTLERVRAAAPEVFTEEPPHLAERVMTAVRAAPIAAVVTLPWWRRVGGRAAVAAAVAGAIVAGALSLPQESDTALVAATKSTEAKKTARVTLSASLTFEPSRPIRLDAPDLRPLRARAGATLPPALRARLDAIATLPRSIRPAPIHRIETGVRARGEVAFSDRLRLEGTMTQRAGALRERGEFESIVVGDDTWMRTRLLGDTWVRLPRFETDLGADFHPGSIMARIRASGDEASDEGRETLDGERVRRYRLTGGTSYGRLVGTHRATVEAWVGDDGLLRRLTETFDGRTERGHLRARTVVTFDGFGSAASIERPRASEETTLDDLVAGVIGYGFGVAGAAFRFSFDAAATMPAFRFPEIPFPDLKFEIPAFEFPEIRIPDFSFELPDFPRPSAGAGFEFRFGPEPTPTSDD